MALQYRANKKAWMNTEVMSNWLRWFDSQMEGRKVVLLMDNFSAHISAVDEPSPPLRNTEVLWLPPNTTSRVQPLDQGIIRTFKAYYRQSWLQYMLAEFEEDRDPFSSTNLLKTFRYLLHAWQAIDDDTIANCWLHSNVNGPRHGPQTKQQYERQQRGYSSTTNPQNTALLASLSSQLSTLQQQQRIKEAMDIDQLLQPKEEDVMETTEDIERAIIDELSPPQEQESDTEGVETLPRVTPLEAIQLLRRLRLHEEQSDDCNNSFIQQLERQERAIQARRGEGLKQRRLDDWWQR